jgi:YT521-B-like domain
VLKQIEELRPIIRGRTRFFIVKSFNLDSIYLSMQTGVWATSPGPTKKLTNAFKNCDHVILIFSVNESRSFQGFAMMESEPDPNLRADLFTSDEASPIQFADNFKVRWIVQCNQPFSMFECMPNNPMNEDLPIKQSKNGQELPFKYGNFLCNMIYTCKVPEYETRVLVGLDKINYEY